MPTKDPNVALELQALASIESGGWYHDLKPGERKPGDGGWQEGDERSIGYYQLNVVAMIDAIGWNIPGTKHMREEANKNWFSQPPGSEVRAKYLDKMWSWMTKNPDQVNKVAEGYYEKVVRDRKSKGNGAVAIMMWHAPDQVGEAIKKYGFPSTPQETQQFIKNTEVLANERNWPVHAARARRLFPMIPAFTPGATDRKKQNQKIGKGIERSLDTKGLTSEDPFTRAGTAMHLRDELSQLDMIAPGMGKQAINKAREMETNPDEFVNTLDPMNGMVQEPITEGTNTFMTAADRFAEDHPLASKLLPGVPLIAGAFDMAVDVTRDLFDMSNVDPVEGLADTGAFMIGAAIAGPPGGAMGFFGRRALKGLSGRSPKTGKKLPKGQEGDVPPRQREQTEIPEEAFSETVEKHREKVKGQLDEAKSQTDALKIELDAFDPADTEGIKSHKAAIRQSKKQERDLELKLDPERDRPKIESIESQLASETNPEKKVKLQSQRDRLIKQAEDAKKSMKPVTKDDVAQIQQNIKGLVETNRLSDKMRTLTAKGKVVGRAALDELADDIEERAGFMAARHPGAVESGLVKRMEEQAAFVRASAARVGDSRVNIGTILGREVDEIQDSITKTGEEIILASRSKEMMDLVDGVLDDPTDLDMQHALRKHLNVDGVMIGKMRRNEVSVGQLQKTVKERGINAQTEIDALELMPPGTDIVELASMIKLIKEGKARKGFIKDILSKKGAGKAALEDLFINGLIASTGVPVWNALSMGGIFAHRVLTRKMAQGFAGSDVAPGEAGVLAKSFLNSYLQLFQAGENMTKRMMREEFDKAFSVVRPKADEQVAGKLGIATDDSMFRQAGEYGRAVTAIGYLVNAPRLAVAISDAGLRFSMKNAYIQAGAYNKAYKEVQSALAQGAKLTDDQIQDILEKRTREIADNPDTMIVVGGKPVRLRDFADDETAVISMMAPLKTKMGRTADQWLKDHFAGRMMIPFFRVMGTNMREALESSPAAKLLPSVKAQIAAGGPEGAAARAKMATGTLMAAGAASMWTEGFITHNGPFDPELRRQWEAAGNNPHVIRIGKEEWPLERFGVLGTVLAFAADATYAMSAMPATLAHRIQSPGVDVYDIMAEGAMNLAAVFTTLTGNEMLFNDFHKLTQAIMAKDVNALNQLVKARATAPIPLSGTLKDLRDYIQGERESAEGWLATLVRSLPLGHVDGISTAYNDWGDKTDDFSELSLGQVILGVVVPNAVDHDLKVQLADRLTESDIVVLGPDRTLEGPENTTIELSTEEHNALKKKFGELGQPGDKSGFQKPFYKELWNLTETPAWKKASAGRQGRRDFMADQIMAPYRKAAIQWLKTESEFAQDIQERMMGAVEYRTREDHSIGINNENSSPFSTIGGQP